MKEQINKPKSQTNEAKREKERKKLLQTKKETTQTMTEIANWTKNEWKKTSQCEAGKDGWRREVARMCCPELQSVSCLTTRFSFTRVHVLRSPVYTATHSARELSTVLSLSLFIYQATHHSIMRLLNGVIIVVAAGLVGGETIFLTLAESPFDF